MHGGGPSPFLRYSRGLPLEWIVYSVQTQRAVQKTKSILHVHFLFQCVSFVFSPHFHIFFFFYGHVFSPVLFVEIGRENKVGGATQQLNLVKHFAHTYIHPLRFVLFFWRIFSTGRGYLFDPLSLQLSITEQRHVSRVSEMVMCAVLCSDVSYTI